jgi:glycosyltransferase involved in cell wall biosynthesis
LIPYHLARCLSERRHAIDLLAFYNRPEDVTDIPRYEQFFRSIRLIREPRRGPLAYTRRLYGGGSFFPQSANAAWSSAMWQAIREQLVVGDYDAIHLFGGIQVYEYRELALPHPNLITPYESYSLYLTRAYEQRSGGAHWLRQIELGIARRYEKRMFVGFDRVVVLADADAQALHTLQPELPLQVIPNGVDTGYFVPTVHEPDEPTLAFVGNYEYAPNLDAALRLAQQIFPLVKQRVPAARLLLIGRAPPAELQALAGLSIEVTGHVQDVRPYLDRTLIFVSALRVGAGLKNKLLEALAMQKPVVATPLSCDGIAVTNEQHVLIAESSEDIARAVIRLLKDGSLRQRIARAGRELVEERYTWRVVAEQYEALYRALSLTRAKRNVFSQA